MKPPKPKTAKMPTKSARVATKLRKLPRKAGTGKTKGGK